MKFGTMIDPEIYLFFNNSLNHNCIICRVPKSGIIKAAEGYKKKIKMINFLSKTYIYTKTINL